MIDLILFPSSYFSVKQVDEDLRQEFRAVQATGLFDIVLFSYDKWFHENKLILNKKITSPQSAVMRGWMMKPEQYKLFYQELCKQNIRLITTPEEYTLMHIFPNVYQFFGNNTAKMKIYPLHKQIAVEEIKQSFSRFMIKDFVKSLKGSQFPEFFDSSVTQEEFDAYMKIFYQYRGDLLTGGICIKEFFDLKRYDGKTNEYRVFYSNHKIAAAGRNSGQKNDSKEPPEDLLEKYSCLASCYYTIDYAELADSSWKIIEAGDGSVSGLPQSQDAEQYFRALYHCF